MMCSHSFLFVLPRAPTELNQLIRTSPSPSPATSSSPATSPAPATSSSPATLPTFTYNFTINITITILSSHGSYIHTFESSYIHTFESLPLPLFLSYLLIITIIPSYLPEPVERLPLPLFLAGVRSRSRSRTSLSSSKLVVNISSSLSAALTPSSPRGRCHEV